ncbi:HNH endonuclease [Acinetobacter junii]|uniref:HNH endonuclease n=1 Tax=Acinetobacter junii TaxID=40215 RepID=UPI000F6696DA|nr:HNH endonuclease [Acinetobacter junii]RSE30169.1 HNH endonuclease [Acinetobacter junii]
MSTQLPNYFWVNHKQTYKTEVGDGYLWSPKVNANNSFNQSYENMKLVKPGDIVFSYAMGVIQALGCARSSAYEAENPFQETGHWGSVGWKVDVDFFVVESKFKPKDFIDEIRPLLPAKYSPISATTGNGNQGCYLAEISANLASYLYEKIDPSGELEIGQLDQDKDENIPLTSKSVYILQRIGQNIFRKELIKKFGHCPLTGIRLNELLRASHIKPWRISNDSERLDSSNGILLAAHVDILFDKGLISFDDEGNLLTKNNEVDNLLEQMNVQTRKIELPQESKKYLKWHRDSFNYPM